MLIQKLVEVHTASALLCGRWSQRSTLMGVGRSKVRVSSRKLAGEPQRNIERQLSSLVLWWAR